MYSGFIRRTCGFIRFLFIFVLLLLLYYYYIIIINIIIFFCFFCLFVKRCNQLLVQSVASMIVVQNSELKSINAVSYLIYIYIYISSQIIVTLIYTLYYAIININIITIAITFAIYFISLLLLLLPLLLPLSITALVLIQHYRHKYLPFIVITIISPFVIMIPRGETRRVLSLDSLTFSNSSYGFNFCTSII